MAGAELRLGARVLMGAAEVLSGTSSRSGLSTDVLTSGMRLKAALGMRSGSEAVRSLGGPFFGRMADDLVAQAASVQGGGPTGPAISSAMDSASWLLKRASTLH
jgi:hypothetical protein